MHAPLPLLALCSLNEARSQIHDAVIASCNMQQPGQGCMVGPPGRRR